MHVKTANLYSDTNGENISQLPQAIAVLAKLRDQSRRLRCDLSGAIFGSGLCEIEVPGSRTVCAGSALNKRQCS